MDIRDHITIYPTVDPPYALHGYYKGTYKFFEHGLTYLVIEGTVGDNIGKDLYVPEMHIKYVEHNPVM